MEEVRDVKSTMTVTCQTLDLAKRMVAFGGAVMDLASHVYPRSFSPLHGSLDIRL